VAQRKSEEAPRFARTPNKFGVRAKLSLIAVALVSILYLCLGVTVFVVARQAIFTSIDSGLNKMAQGFDRQHRHRGGPFGGGPPGAGPGPGPWDPHDDHHRDHGPEDGPHGPPNMFDGDQPPRTNEQRPAIGQRQALEPIDIHEGRPRVVWREPDAPFPFPESSPIDAGSAKTARGGITTLRTVTFDDEPIRVLTFPVFRGDSNHVEGVVQLSYWLGDIYKVLNTLAGTLLLILPMGIVLMGWASMAVVGRTLRPVREIRAAAAKIEAEDLSGRLPVSGKDEFAELAETMNGMLERLDSAFTRQRETLEQLREVVQQQRRFTADASHELKTPLAVVKVNASFLKSSLAKDPDGLEMVEAVDQAVDRMSRLVQDLLLLARTDSGQLGEHFEAVDLVETAKRAIGLIPCKSRVTLQTEASELWISGSAFALERVMTNLLDNACRHTNSEGEICLTLQARNSEAVFSVTDDGQGIPASHLEKIFERFHRVDDSRQSGTGGSGLGLAICKGIIEAHHGTISVQSVLGKGTSFTVRLPIILPDSLAA
jgi:signal transduction histidine kinase